jgi:RNA-directed DNA polymerase
MTVEQLGEHLRTGWPRIREQLLAGTYQPTVVLRREIPKAGGEVCELGIPTVVDRLVQQAILQVLQPRFDPTFSEHSLGFRPGRRAHDAVIAAQRYVQEGRRWVVDMDLERFFDRPAAGAARPRLRPLCRRLQHLCAVGGGGQRVMASMRRMYARLRLRVNESKSAVARAETRKILGFSLWRRGRTVNVPVAPAALETFRRKVRELTNRNRGASLRKVVADLAVYLRGWKQYFRLAQTPRIFRDLDRWFRRRIRMLQLKQWKRGRTAYRALLADGTPPALAKHLAMHLRRWWWSSNHPAIKRAISPDRLLALGLPSLGPVAKDLNLSNRRMRTRLSGGVGGEPAGSPPAAIPIGARTPSTSLAFPGMTAGGMKRFLIVTMIGVCACGGSQRSESPPPTGTDRDGASAGDSSAAAGARRSSDAGEFQVNDADKSSRPVQAKLEATDTMAALRFFVIDKKKGPIEGIVVSLTSPTGAVYYTEETDKEGFAELLVPIGQTYELVYLSLGRRNVAAKVEVRNEPRLNLKLTMRHEREEPAKPFVLDDVQFATGKATIKPDSFERLDALVEYMTHKKTSRIEISGHTDNAGKKAVNKKLSQQRADAVRDYLVSKGIGADRIKAVGYGDEKPIAPNDTSEGRQKNRRIEAIAM